MDLLLFSLGLIAGLIFLLKSSDIFVEGAAQTAKYFGMSQFLIGVLIVGFGTSAPEMIVSATAALSNSPELALGNAYGSNIANIALILGVTAIISPIMIDKKVLFKEAPKLIIAIIISFALIYDNEISKIDASILLSIFAIFLLRMILLSKKDNENNNKETNEKINIKKALVMVILGVTILILSSKLLVWGAVGIAKFFNVSDLVIGLTVVAIGTSLPELASSVAAAKKGNNDLAIGNVIGSNLFNTYVVVGIAGVIAPIHATPDILFRDMTIMTILTISLIIFGLPQKRLNDKGIITRIKGSSWLIIYLGYTAYLVFDAINQ